MLKNKQNAVYAVCGEKAEPYKNSDRIFIAGREIFLVQTAGESEVHWRALAEADKV